MILQYLMLIPDIYLNILLAMVLGIVLGLERFIAYKIAGMRTYAFISMGAALFVVISQIVTSSMQVHNFDPLRIAAQVVAAAGFLGVGTIIRRSDNQVSGVTTASGMWVAAGIGMASGFGLYTLAIVTTVFSLFIFIVLWFIEKQLRNIQLRQNKKGEEIEPL